MKDRNKLAFVITERPSHKVFCMPNGALEAETTTDYYHRQSTPSTCYAQPK
jgi:hypothetical protein